MARAREQPMMEILGNIDRHEIQLTDLESKFEEAAEQWRSHGEVVTSMPAWTWLRNQSACTFALNKLSKATTTPVPGEWIKNAARIRSIEDPGTAWRHLQSLARMSRKDTWFYLVLNGVCEYLYSDNAERFLESLGAINKVTAEFRSSARKFNELCEFIHEATEFAPRPRPQLERIESYSSYLLDMSLALPIQRNTQRKAEQLLAYRFYNANWVGYRKVKPDAIADLMNLEGVREVVDLRTIERWCKGFKERRQLLRQVRS